MKHFGTDGIRKEANFFLENEFAYHVGRAVVALGVPHVIIAQDTRESSEAIKKMVMRGAQDQGLYVYDIGVVPTPVLAYLSFYYQTIGVMITASHNPYVDNGIKVLLHGEKLQEKTEILLEQEINTQTFPKLVSKKPSLVISLQPYLDKLNQFSFQSFSKVIFDFANGAGSFFGPPILQYFLPNALFIHQQPNGKNINENCGSTHLEQLQQMVRAEKNAIGFAFDGDGDRVLVVDEEGNRYDGDHLLYVFALYLNQQGKLNKQQVVMSIMSNLGVIAAMKKSGIEVITTPVGDKFILEKLSSEQLTLGGEASGHIINTTLLNSGDGIMNALFLLQILHETNQSLSQLTQAITIYPEKLVNLKGIKREVLNLPIVQSQIAKWQEAIGQDARLVVRASGTEALIRVSACAKDQSTVDTYIEKVVALLKSQEG